MISTQLRTFLAVAQTSSFSAAAKQLGVTQPYVSRQIKYLESLGGNVLFERLGRSIRMTDLGRDLTAIAKRMLDAEADAYNLLISTRLIHAGYLRIAAVGPYHLNQMLARFRAKHPAVNISVSFGDSSKVEQAVIDMDVDIGILAVSRRIPHCQQRTLRRCPIVLQVPHDHALAQRSCVSVQELAGQTLIARESTSTTRRLFDALLLEHDIEMSSTLELGSREAIRLAVASGLGVGYVSEQECDPHPDVRYVRIEESPFLTNTTLVWRSGREHSGITRAFLDSVEEGHATDAGSNTQGLPTPEPASDAAPRP